jgi:hypothetical protein
MPRDTHAVVIDPEADRPALIGSAWTRRVPEGDEYDDIVVRGVFDLGERGGGLELVVSPLTFGVTLTTTAEGLTESYKRADGDDPVENLRARVRELESRA